jgi:hypothetical protein
MFRCDHLFFVAALLACVGCGRPTGPAGPASRGVTAGVGPAGEAPPARPDREAVRKWMADSLVARFTAGPADAPASWYAWSGAWAHRARGESGLRFDVTVSDLPPGRDRKDVLAEYRVRVVPVGLKVWGKPATFQPADFPALLPWKGGVAMGTAEYTVTYYAGQPGPAVIGDKQGQWFDSLRPLDRAQLVKLLNQDQAPVLSAGAKPVYAQFRAASLKMAVPEKGSYFVFRQDLIGDDYGHKLDAPAGPRISDENGGGTQDLLADMGYTGIYAVNAKYVVAEIRGGSHQAWVAEDQPKEADPINGVSFRGTAYLAVRGWQRGRRVILSKRFNTRDLPSTTVADWGEWHKPETRLAEFRVVVKNGKASWRCTTEKPFLRPDYRDALEPWCASEAAARKVIQLVGVSDRPLRETDD